MIVRTTPKSQRRSARDAVRDDPRPLYLGPGADVYVALDGPALSISRDERASQLFPLRRLSRVVSARDIAWSSSALLACAEHGVSVLFLDDHGEIVARLMGRPGERDELNRRLIEFLLLPQAQGMYGYWFRNYRRRASHWAGLKLEVPIAQRDPAHCRPALERIARREAGEAVALETRQWFRTLAYAWMQAHLQDLGIGAGQSLGQVGEPNLAKDLTDILTWYLEPARIGWLRSRRLAAKRKGEPVRDPTHRETIALFESSAMRVAERGREITGTLHRWLIHET
jgi:hypothetical protein